MEVPDFIEQPTIDFENKVKPSRLLLKLSEIDVQRDILDVQFVMNNRDANEDDKFEYFLSLEKWTPRQMDVKINFTDPTVISQGLN